MESKPGYLTTEFWITVLTALFGVANATNILDYLPNGTGAFVAAIVTALYSVSRGLAKQGVADDPALRRRRR